jgi:single-strand DNA-binding protein
MGDVNRVTLLGNVGALPELKYTRSNKAFAVMKLATNWRDGGAHSESTEWHRIVLWDDLAERAAKYVKKGMKLYIEGRIQTRTYVKPEDPEKQRYYLTEIIADRMTFVTARFNDERPPEKRDVDAQLAPIPGRRFPDVAPSRSPAPADPEGARIRFAPAGPEADPDDPDDPPEEKLPF